MPHRQLSTRFGYRNDKRLNIVLRDKGPTEEEELEFGEADVLEFICCCCATAVDGTINLLN